MPKLIESLALSGSRLSDGSPNASGKVWIYEQGTTVLASSFSDVAGDAVFSQPVTLDAAGRATIYVDQTVTVHVETSTGATVADYDLSDSPGVVRVENPAFSGTLPSGAHGAGGETDLDSVLLSAKTSLGGTDFQYLEATGATARKLADWMRQVWISVKDYGAIGNGIVNDASAIQAAINRVAALGGGIVYFPPGTYLSGATQTNSTAGVVLAGAGPGVSILKNTTAGSTAVSFSGANSVGVRDLAITNSNASNTASGLAFASCTGVALSNVTVDTHSIALNLTGSTSRLSAVNCLFAGANIDATSRGVVFNTTGNLFYLVGNRITGTSGSGVELASSAALVFLSANQISGSVNSILFNNAYTGTRQYIVGNDLDGSTSINFGSLTVMPSGYHVTQNNGPGGGSLDGTSVTVTSGSHATVDLSKGQEVRITGTTTGSAYTVDAPAVLPNAATRGYYIAIQFRNSAGSDVTGWTLAAVYHVNTTIPVTNGFSTILYFLWDGVFREVGRATSPT